MSLLAKIFPVGKAVDGIEAIGNIVDNLFTSEEERLTKKEMMVRLLQEPGKAQTEINKIEASHRSLFVAGWRPFIGWVCGVGLMWAFIGHPITEWAFVFFEVEATPPKIVTDHMMELVLALLGLSGLRSYEKIQGKAK